jgi:hypothetical protein
MEAQDQHDRKQMKEAALGTAAVAALGIAAGLASIFLAKKS